MLTATLSGLSKLAGLPQLKLSWIVVSGPPDLQAAALARLDVIADTYLSVATPVQLALPSLLRAGRRTRAQIGARIRANRAVLEAALAAEGLARVLAAGGGWYAVVQVPAVISEDAWALTLLEADDVVVHPGYFFDFPAGCLLVVSLLPEPAVFAEGAARLARRVAAVTGGAGPGPGAGDAPERRP